MRQPVLDVQAAAHIGTMTITSETPVSSSGHLIMELMAGSDTAARTRAQAAHLAAVQTHKAAQATVMSLADTHPEARFVSVMFDSTGTAQLLDLLGRDRRSLTLYGFISTDAINYPHLKEGVCCSGSSLAETR